MFVLLTISPSIDREDPASNFCFEFSSGKGYFLGENLNWNFAKVCMVVWLGTYSSLHTGLLLH